jgi:alpha-ketoglutarate-dependent taurine dioxygenase
LADLRGDGLSLLCDVDPSDEQAILNIASTIGSLDLGVDIELAGPPVMDLRYDPRKVAVSDRPAYFTADYFPLHTDLSYVVTPPRYLLMHCVVPALSGQGLILLSDCRLAFNALSRDERDLLSTPIFRFRFPPNCPLGQSEEVAVYDTRTHSWRFRPDSMIIPPHAQGTVDEFSAALDTARVALSLEAGNLLIVDNHRMVHGRTAFDSGDADDYGRHLRRTYAQSN